MFFKKRKIYSEINFSLDEERKIYKVVLIENVPENGQIRFERKETQKTIEEVEKIIERIK